MTEWIPIGGFLLATRAAGVGFVVSRVMFSGRKRQKQFSPK